MKAFDAAVIDDYKDDQNRAAKSDVADQMGLARRIRFNSLLLKRRETNKKTAGIFLDTLGDIAYKATKKTGEFVVPGLGGGDASHDPLFS